MKGWQRFVLLTAAAVIIIAGGLFAWQRYSDWRAERLAEEAALKDAKKTVAEQTAGTEYFLKSTYSDSDMTYAQLFDRVDDRTKKITDAIVSVQSSELGDEQKQAAVDYLNALSATLDAMEMEYRKGLNSSNSVDSMKSAESDYVTTPYNEYSDPWERKRLLDARDEAQKALNEFKDAVRSYNAALKTLRKTTSADQAKLNGFYLVNGTVLSKAITHSDEEVKSTT